MSVGLVLNGCQKGVRVEADSPVSTKERRQLEFGSLIGEDGLTFSMSKSAADKTLNAEKTALNYTQNTVNPHLWRATLDAFHGVPLAISDTLGGIIVTDWYFKRGIQNKRFKIQINILTKGLRSDGIKVTVFQEKRAAKDWISAGTNDKLAQKLETLILKRARALNIKG